jgi:prolyl-tRNA synthetase
VTVEIGPRDLENGTAFVGRRDQGAKREGTDCEAFVDGIVRMLEDIQRNLFERALAFREENTRTIDSKEELYSFFTSANPQKPEIHGGFALVHWDRDPKWEEQLKNDLKVTVRCIPDESSEEGICVFSGNHSPGRVVLAKSY